MAILTGQDKQRIEAAIGRAEQGTVAEIVVQEVRRSDSYLDVRLGLAALLSLGGSAALHALITLPYVGELFALEIVLFALGLWLFGAPPLLRHLLPPRRAQAAVARAAALGFLEHGVFATRDRSGVLILLSELEHKVVILGDQGIHARLAQAGWDAHVATIVQAIRAGKAGDGVCQVIEALGMTLAEAAPQRAGDTDELANRVR